MNQTHRLVGDRPRGDGRRRHDDLPRAVSCPPELTSIRGDERVMENLYQVLLKQGHHVSYVPQIRWS